MSEVAAKTTRVDRSFRLAGGAMLAVGAVLGLIGAATASSDPLALQHAYMFGWVYWACVVFGCLGLTLLHHTGRGDWGFPVLRILEAGGSWINIVLFGVLFAPIALIWRQDFYPWARPDVVLHDPVLQHKSGYLNDNFWLLRTVVYFVVFAWLAWVYQRWTRFEEQTGDEKWWQKRQYWGGMTLVLYVVFSNFMWTDWMMSQYPHWYSTIYGVWFVVSSALMAYAVCAIVIGTQSEKAPYNEVVRPWLTKDIGNWMLAFTMLWAYFSLSQYLIIWSGNLPEFIEYFVQRSVNGWREWGIALIILHFFVPFLLLLSPRVKRVPRLLAMVGFLILGVRVLDTIYHVTPTWKPSVANINLLDFGFLFLFGGVWCLLFAWQVKQAPLITFKAKPRLTEAVEHA